jgi:hypothetical protein
MKPRFALIITGVSFLSVAGLDYMDYSSLGFPTVTVGLRTQNPRSARRGGHR